MVKTRDTHLLVWRRSKSSTEAAGPSTGTAYSCEKLMETERNTKRHKNETERSTKRHKNGIKPERKPRRERERDVERATEKMIPPRGASAAAK
jgi:hypothetical protein